MSTSIHKPPHTFLGPNATLEPGSGVVSSDAPLQWLDRWWFQPHGWRTTPGCDGGWEWSCGDLAARVTRYRNDVWIAGICGTTGHGKTFENALDSALIALMTHTDFSLKILARIEKSDAADLK